MHCASVPIQSQWGSLLLCSLHELYKALERSWTGTGCGPHMIPQELPGETWSTSWDPWRETWSTSWAPWRETWSTSWGPWSTSWGPWSTSWGPWRDLEHFLGPLERFLGPLERFLGQGSSSAKLPRIPFGSAAAKASRTSQAFPSPNRFKQLYRGRMNSGSTPTSWGAHQLLNASNIYTTGPRPSSACGAAALPSSSSGGGVRIRARTGGGVRIRARTGGGVRIRARTGADQRYTDSS
uniref:Uncharacterized protein n=1 Tax=Gadus morhua TaxID=8049 RepID=A0A8C5CHF0_GADMO